MNEHTSAHKIIALSMKYLKDELSETERLELENWLESRPNRILFEQVTSEPWIKRELEKFNGYAIDAFEDIERIRKALLRNRSTVRNNRVLAGIRYMTAAVIVITLSVGSYVIFHSVPGKATALAPVLPGKDSATLTLENGFKIDLDGKRKRVIAKKGTTKIVKNGGQITFKPHDKNSNEGWLIRGLEDSVTNNSPLSYQNDTTAAIVQLPVTSDSSMTTFNTVSTPRGGQYSLVLPDGSQVWLNAASSLKFPTTFGNNTRKVTLTGEGYFEIRHMEKMPFIVSANEVELLATGTSFNVNVYADEPDMVVTLLEGTLSFTIFNKPFILESNSQAKITTRSVTIFQNEGVDNAIAWKKGLFVFEKATLQTIMNQIRRWYDVNAIVEAKDLNETFTVKIPRSASLPDFLNLLVLSGNLNFKLIDRTVIIKRK